MDNGEFQNRISTNYSLDLRLYSPYNAIKRPEFEYDEAKSFLNAEKHGIDFEEAQELWDGPHFVTPVEFKGERRYSVVGKIGGEYWTAIATDRKGHVRIISVRRSIKKEASYYDGRRNENNP
ncbi:toxin [Slackia equolifaciens]|uniref:Toxin n=1 Tax=Slackia equolifaciens TaxID=498718 RepID=A0A3N0B4M0_9ACTN|nr:BrnT family toxin [Slackia equolifaciens]RNL42067.1 toxin [Slackia equolifaciens]